MDHRKQDLSQLLDKQDLDALQIKFKEAGWDVGTAEILAVARDISPSNHWKDIIQKHLDAKGKESDAPPKSDNAAPTKTTKKGSKGKAAPSKSGD